MPFFKNVYSQFVEFKLSYIDTFFLMKLISHRWKREFCICTPAGFSPCRSDSPLLILIQKQSSIGQIFKNVDSTCFHSNRSRSRMGGSHWNLQCFSNQVFSITETSVIELRFFIGSRSKDFFLLATDTGSGYRYFVKTERKQLFQHK